MPGGYGYEYGGPQTKHTAQGMLGGGAKGAPHKSSMRQGTTKQGRYRSMESPMFCDAMSHGEGKGPWPGGGSKSGKGRY